MSRQLWDECRHAMMGEVGFYKDGMPFYAYPVDLKSSMALNTELEPIEAHTILWAIEQSLMPKETGKRFEWVIAKSSGNDLAAMFQDYDWADEVLHAQIGRKWLVPVYGSIEEMKKQAGDMFAKWGAVNERLALLSKQEPWWPAFMDNIRQRREALQA